MYERTSNNCDEKLAFDVSLNFRYTFRLTYIKRISRGIAPRKPDTDYAAISIFRRAVLKAAVLFFFFLFFAKTRKIENKERIFHPVARRRGRERGENLLFLLSEKLLSPRMQREKGTPVAGERGGGGSSTRCYPA